jgi:hypothetical protein
MPVAFDCECGQRWWSPPDVTCTVCGPSATATPDPVIWSVDRIQLPWRDGIFLSAQLRDAARFAEVAALGIRVFVDVAGGAPYVWRPSADEIAAAGVTYVEIAGVEDLNTDLPPFAFRRVAEALGHAVATEQKTLLFCAAGLKRSPHLLYGVLRSWRFTPRSAWKAIVDARPFVDPWQPYLEAAERWVATR